MIDPQLEHAGWYLRDHSKVKIEIHVDGYDAKPWKAWWNGSSRCEGRMSEGERQVNGLFESLPAESFGGCL
jgi:hypothetical protein